MWRHFLQSAYPRVILHRNAIVIPNSECVSACVCVSSVNLLSLNWRVTFSKTRDLLFPTSPMRWMISGSGLRLTDTRVALRCFKLLLLLTQSSQPHISSSPISRPRRQSPPAPVLLPAAGERPGARAGLHLHLPRHPGPAAGLHPRDGQRRRRRNALHPY